MQAKDLILIIPFYNAENIIEEVLSSWLETLSQLKISFMVMIYDDASTDNTWNILQSMSLKSDRVQLFRNETHLGQGASLIKAYGDHISSAHWIMVLEGDNEMQAIHFNRFWELREDFDLLSGRRFYFERQFLCEIVSFVASWWVRFLFGKGLKDVNSPYRLFRSICFAQLFLSLDNKTQAPHLMQSAYALKKKLKIKELWVPLEMRDIEDQVMIPSQQIIRRSILAMHQSGHYFFQEFSSK